MVYSVTTLSKLHYYDEIPDSDQYNSTFNFNYTSSNTNSTNSLSEFLLHIKMKLCIISPFEILIFIWVFSLFLEEFNQVSKTN